MLLFWAVFTVTVLANGRLSGLFIVAILALLGGLYMSLQHEVIHGHPTPWPRLNWLMVSLTSNQQIKDNLALAAADVDYGLARFDY